MRDPVVCVCPCRSACVCTHASMCVRKTAVPQAACVYAVGLQTRDETPDAHNALDVDVADVTRLECTTPLRQLNSVMSIFH